MRKYEIIAQKRDEKKKSIHNIELIKNKYIYNKRKMD